MCRTYQYTELCITAKKILQKFAQPPSSPSAKNTRFEDADF